MSKKFPTYLFICVALVFSWFALRPFIEPLVYDFHRLDISSKFTIIVDKYYQNRGTGYVNNQLLIPDLINEKGMSLIRIIRKRAILQKQSGSDSLFVKIDSDTYVFVIQNSST
jgi:hypothetical protein